MKNEEIPAAALSDPDAQPFRPCLLAGFRGLPVPDASAISAARERTGYYDLKVNLFNIFG